MKKKNKKIFRKIVNFFKIDFFKIKKLIFVIPGVIFILRKTKNKKIVLSCHSAIGDTLYSCALLNEFISQDNYEYTLFVPKKRRNIVERFNFKNIFYYNKFQEMIMQCVIYSRLGRKLIKKRMGKSFFVSFPWFYFEKKAYDQYDMDFFSLLKKDVFKLKKENPKIEYIKVPEKKLSIDTKQKYIIFIPYSFSQRIPMKVLEYIANKMKEKGYVCYSNVYKKQKEIPGTIRFDSSIDELALASKSAYAIIGVRTGALDYVVPYARKIFALYDNAQDFHMYNLNQWQTSCEIHEYLYGNYKKADYNKIDKIVDDIEKALS